MLLLPVSLRDTLVAEARAAFPRECCGLIEGVRHEGCLEAVALHPTRNFATDLDRFEIDPAQHIRLLRVAREAGRGIVGCYHSHPGGSAAPSERDRLGAGENDFVWLIAALGPMGDAAFGVYRFADGRFEEGVLADA